MGLTNTIGLPADDVRDVDCPLCGASDATPLADRADGLTIVRCSHCSLAFLSPRPSDEAIRRLYDNYLADSSRTRSYTQYEQLEQNRVRGQDDFFATVLDGAERVRPGCFQAARVLDIGCATGGLLELARRRGAHVRGVELDAQAARTARERWGIDVHAGTVEQAGLARGSQDVVTSLDVIEHVTDLHAFVATVNQVTARGGLWVVTTPNFGLFASQGRHYRGLASSLEHILYFEPATLTRLLGMHGFHVRQCTAFCPTSLVVHVADRVRARQGLLRRAYAIAKRVPGVRRLVWSLLHAVGRVREKTQSAEASGATLLIVAEKVAESQTHQRPTCLRRAS